MKIELSASKEKLEKEQLEQIESFIKNNDFETLTIANYKTIENLINLKAQLNNNENKIKKLAINVENISDCLRLTNIFPQANIEINLDKLRIQSNLKIFQMYIRRASGKKVWIILNLKDVETLDETGNYIINNDFRNIKIQLPVYRKITMQDIQRIKDSLIAFVNNNPHDLIYTIKIENNFPSCLWTQEEIMQLALRSKGLDKMGIVNNYFSVTPDLSVVAADGSKTNFENYLNVKSQIEEAIEQIKITKCKNCTLFKKHCNYQYLLSEVINNESSNL